MKSSTKYYSTIQEKMVADCLGRDFHAVSGSGAAPCTPGDVIGPDWLIECKTHVTVLPNLIFNRNVWKKIKEEAFAKHRHPALVTDNGTQKLSETWILIRESDAPKHRLFPTKVTDLDLRSTVNTIIDIATLKSTIRESKKDCQDFMFHCIRCKLDSDTCLVMQLSTFEELIGD